jgi:ABC-type Zn uptake system ZnuABC Zn-binding protein ZnuA
VIAEQLTIPEEVTEYNIEKIISLAKSNRVKFIIVTQTDPKTRQKRFQALNFDLNDTEEQIR